jgi:hypothetical protein
VDVGDVITRTVSSASAVQLSTVEWSELVAE